MTKLKIERKMRLQHISVIFCCFFVKTLFQLNTANAENHDLKKDFVITGFNRVYRLKNSSDLSESEDCKHFTKEHLKFNKTLISEVIKCDKGINCSVLNCDLILPNSFKNDLINKQLINQQINLKVCDSPVIKGGERVELFGQIEFENVKDVSVAIKCDLSNFSENSKFFKVKSKELVKGLYFCIFVKTVTKTELLSSISV